MTSFVFWNLKRCLKPDLVSILAHAYEVDILLLAECAIQPNVLLSRLNHKRGTLYDYAHSTGCDKIKIFTRFHRQFIMAIVETDRLTVRHLKLPGAVNVLVAAVHFPSKLHWRDSSQVAESVNLSISVKDAEKLVGHSRTVLMGDFNMNPFELGMINANSLHAVMDKDIAKKRTRKVEKVEYPYFYNPMWSLMGDATPGPPGTFYYSSSEPSSYFWNMFDQVLLRPDLLEHFDNHDLKIIDRIDNMPLLSANGRPNSTIASDHLPIYFELNL